MNKLVLNKDIYSKASVEEVINVYKNFAKIEVSDDKDSTIVVFRSCRYDEDLTKKEFENYLIGVENANGNN